MTSKCNDLEMVGRALGRSPRANLKYCLLAFNLEL